jgi:hypothetical protein
MTNSNCAIAASYEAQVFNMARAYNEVRHVSPDLIIVPARYICSPTTAM